MRFAKLSVLCATLLVVAGAASADGVLDPQIIIRGDPATSISMTSPNLIISVPNNPGCKQTTTVLNNVTVPVEDCGIHNMTGFDIYTITLQFTLDPNLNPLVLGGNLFGAQSFTFDPNTGIVTAIFSLGVIPAGQDFHIEFINFDPGTSFDIVAQSPEPATLALFASGLGAIIARRRMRKR